MKLNFCQTALFKIKGFLWEEVLPVCILFSQGIMLSEAIFIWPLIFYLCFKWKIWIFFCLGYYLWTRYDSTVLKTEGRRFTWLRNLRIFESVRDYFPLRLIKTAPLPPDENYILGCYPHGIVPFGMMTNFSTNVNNWDKLYPGVEVRGAMISAVFSFPVAREYFMAMGACTSDEDNIKYLLNSKKSMAVGICPGGVKEFYYSRPGSEYTVVKENRKGFIRIALQTGSSLVPVFSFGENNILEQGEVDSPLWKFFSDQLHKLSRMRFYTIRGRGPINLLFNFVPHRRPITTIVGAPLQVPKVENPSDELVDEYKEKFWLALVELFEKYKHTCDEAGGEATLRMV